VVLRAAEPGRTGGETDPRDREQEVEVERGQPLGRAQRDDGVARQPAGGEAVPVVHGVRAHVDPAVAVQGEVRIADAGRPGAGLGRGRGPVVARRVPQGDRSAGHQTKSDQHGRHAGEHGCNLAEPRSRDG
jgi:hypothetical protein